MIDRIRGYLWYVKIKLRLWEIELLIAFARSLKRLGLALRSLQD